MLFFISKQGPRHAIRQLAIQGETMSANKDCLGDFKANLLQHFEEEGLSLSQVHNCNETGLCCKALPTKTLASQREKKAHGHKIE